MAASREFAQHFGLTLARIRREADLSQERLGLLASLHRTEIGMLERGIRLARVDTLVKLCGALEVQPADLLAGLDWAPGGEPRLGSFQLREGGKAGEETS